MTGNYKMNYLQHITNKCFGEQARARTGLCMIIFAVPLLIPAVTMTTVAFEDETGFSRYSALHIFGMILMAVAILLLVVGFLLRVRFITRVTPNDDLLVMSTHIKMQKNIHQNIDVKVNIRDYPSTDSDPLSEFNQRLPHVNYMNEQDHGVTNIGHGVSSGLGVGATPDSYRRGFHGQSSSMKSLVDDSSSDTSSDSEDYSSASYTITEEATDKTIAPSLESDYTAVNTRADNFLHSLSKAQEQTPELSFSKFKTIIVQSTGMNSNNFFQSSNEDNVNEVNELSNTKMTNYSQTKKRTGECHDSRMSVTGSCQNNGDVFQTIPSHVTKLSSEAQNEEIILETRQRLQGLSSDATSLSSEILLSPDTGVMSADVLLNQSVESSEGNFTDNRASVFSITKDSMPSSEMLNNSTAKDVPAESSRLNNRRSWTQSPYTTQTFLISTRDRLSKSSSTIATPQSPHLKHPDR